MAKFGAKFVKNAASVLLQRSPPQDGRLSTPDAGKGVAPDRFASSARTVLPVAASGGGKPAGAGTGRRLPANPAWPRLWGRQSSRRCTQDAPELQARRHPNETRRSPAKRAADARSLPPGLHCAAAQFPVNLSSPSALKCRMWGARQAFETSPKDRPPRQAPAPRKSVRIAAPQAEERKRNERRYRYSFGRRHRRRHYAGDYGLRQRLTSIDVSSAGPRNVVPRPRCDWGAPLPMRAKRRYLGEWRLPRARFLGLEAEKFSSGVAAEAAVSAQRMARPTRRAKVLAMGGG